MMGSKIWVSLVEDDEIIRRWLEETIDHAAGLRLLRSYSSCESALRDIKRHLPDVILMDIELPGISGIEGISRLKKRFPDIDIIVLTVHTDNELVFKALCAGAHGYLTKNTSQEKLIDALQEVYNGGAAMSTHIARMVVNSFQKNRASSPLTARETQVLELLTRGKSYKMIADELIIDKETVRTHIKNIYRKLEVHCKADAIELALKQGLI